MDDMNPPFDAGDEANEEAASSAEKFPEAATSTPMRVAAGCYSE
jgi:hypothetical protein